MLIKGAKMSKLTIADFIDQNQVMFNEILECFHDLFITQLFI